ncbi:MAG TPA: hypothetical protein VH415_11185 [Nitrososphaeraceae archaeon]
MIRIRNNGRVRRIEIEPGKLEVIQKTLQSNCSEIIRDSVMRRLAERTYCVCSGLATQIVTYDLSDNRQNVHKIEKYCDKCVKIVYEREPIF